MTPLETAERETAHSLLAVETLARRVLLAAAAPPAADPVRAAQIVRERLVPAIYRVRRAARAKGAERLHAEMRAQGVALPEVQVAASHDADLALAMQTATHYADALAKDATAADQRRVRVLTPRIDTIAAADSASAFNDERTQVEKAVAKDPRAVRILPIAIKSWSARLESKTTCRVCRDMHGQVRSWGFDFESDREPGKVHPRCRCFSRYLLAPVGWKEAA